jgi:serine protease AprX
MVKWTFTISFVLLIIFFSAGINAQIAPNRYWIEFSDKLNSPYSINHPEEYLSERSINRRLQHNIDINTNDLPVNPAYIDSLEAIGLIIINTSKWLNGAIVETYDTSLLTKTLKLSFVSHIPLFNSISNNEESALNKYIDEQKKADAPSYGESRNQIEMLNGDYLHNKGYYGDDLLIAVLDAGFNNANLISSLQHLWNDNKIVASYDFVKDGSSFFSTYQHGTFVLTAMAGIEDNVIFGTATEAQYLLIRTEKEPTEYVSEEYNWVCGAEYADSIGADIINSSLGYTQFDNKFQNHTYSDMDGKTNMSSIGASLASSKGMLVVVSAGNSGNKTWGWIGSPADADNILTIGAVDPYGIRSDFSSHGPTYDGRIKPDVCAQGENVIVQNQSGTFVGVGGTSLSSPIIAGMAACLWQANPGATNLQIIDAIRQSSSQYTKPDSLYGYGIPDFGRADRIVKNILAPQESLPFSFFNYPNPVKNILSIEIYQKESDKPHQAFLNVYDLAGRICAESVNILISENSMINIDLNNLSTGVYYLIINIEGRKYSSVFLKLK